MKTGQHIRFIGDASGQVGTKDGQFNFPRVAAVSEEDELFVSDYGNHRVQVFDWQSGLFLRSFGSSLSLCQASSANGQFNGPLCIRVLEDELYVSETGNHRIQVLDKMSGRFLLRLVVKDWMKDN